jgi:hypothetical protein
MIRNVLYGCLCAMLLSAGTESRNQNTNQRVVLAFRHYIGHEELELGKIYTNTLGESFLINKFRYYVSHITLTDSFNNPVDQNNNTCFLINEKEETSKEVVVNIPPGGYSKLSFLIGVDSTHNVSGAQTGALDPLNDMFWTWRSGYVMAKMEGEANVSSLPHHIFEYHIGGFKGKHNVLQRVELTFPSSVNVAPGKSLVLNIAADINAWFHSAHSLSIAQYPACTSEGALAKQFSENYRNMFSVQTIPLQ